MQEPPMEFPPDFKPAPTDNVLHELKNELFYFERAVAANKVRPELVRLRRWCLKSAIYLLQQQPAGALQPTPEHS